VAGAIGHQAKARASLDFNSAGFIERDCRSRGIVRYEGLSNTQFSNRRVSADGFRTDARRTFEARYIPARPGRPRFPQNVNRKAASKKRGDRRERGENRKLKNGGPISERRSQRPVRKRAQGVVG
jgi:hypothetical protein